MGCSAVCSNAMPETGSAEPRPPEFPFGRRLGRSLALQKGPPETARRSLPRRNWLAGDGGDTLLELGDLFEKHDFNTFPVLEDGMLVGVVTKFDFLRTFSFTTGQMVPRYEELMKRTVAEAMTDAIVHVEPSAPLTRVLQLMVNLRMRSFPVVGAGGALVGMISREDVVRALKETAGKDEPVAV